VVTRRVTKNLQQGRSDGEGTGYRGDIPVIKVQEAPYNLDPESVFVNRFWGRRPGGVAINEALKIVCILEFKRSTDMDEGFLKVKNAEANEQHKSIIGALKKRAGFESVEDPLLYRSTGFVIRAPGHYSHSVSCKY